MLADSSTAMTTLTGEASANVGGDAADEFRFPERRELPESACAEARTAEEQINTRARVPVIPANPKTWCNQLRFRPTRSTENTVVPTPGQLYRPIPQASYPFA